MINIIAIVATQYWDKETWRIVYPNTYKYIKGGPHRDGGKL